MASMTFRFTTECEMTLVAASYEEAYLRFKDFMHGQISDDFNTINVLPPESVQIFFQTDHGDDIYQIEQFKGDFREDIVTRCGADKLVRTREVPLMWQFRDIRIDSIPEVYW